MNDLIKRLEEATEGSRLLDLEIARLAYPDGGIGDAVMAEPDDQKSGSPLLRQSNGHEFYLYIPAFTTSLDAALTLVPERWWAEIHTIGHATLDSRDVEDLRVEGEHYTAPMALCIAALKARSAA